MLNMVGDRSKDWGNGDKWHWTDIKEDEFEACSCCEVLSSKECARIIASGDCPMTRVIPI